MWSLLTASLLCTLQTHSFTSSSQCPYKVGANVIVPLILKLMLREAKSWSQGTLWISGKAPSPAKPCITEFMNCSCTTGPEASGKVKDIVDLAHGTLGCSSDFCMSFVRDKNMQLPWNVDISMWTIQCLWRTIFTKHFYPSSICSPAQVCVVNRD